MHIGSTVFVAWWQNALWAAPVIGAAVCLLAYLVGRCFLVGRPRPQRRPVEDVGANFLNGVTRDRRSAPRRAGNAVEALLADGSDQPPLQVWVTDRSAGGIQILVNDALPQGGRYKIRASRSDTSTPWLDVLVRSCRREGSQWEVGCQFLQPPPWNLLLQFG